MFKTISKASFLIIFLLSLIGCASNPASLDRNHLKTNKISTINLTSPNKLSHEISDTATSSASSGGFGMLGVLVGASVDSVINARRAKALQPIVAALGDFNTRLIFASKLRTIKGASFKSGLQIKSSAENLKSGLNVLDVRANYFLSSTHQFVTVNATTNLKTTEKAENYYRTFSATKNIDFNLKKDEKINATQFLINNPNKLRTAINAGMDDIIKQIAVDINIGEEQ